MMVSKPMVLSSPPAAKYRFYAKLANLRAQIFKLVDGAPGVPARPPLYWTGETPVAPFSNGGDLMQFGITIKPDMPVERIVALTRQAEASGFEYGWIFDSHVLWLEPFLLITLMATNTKKMRPGPCATNPATRDMTFTSSLFATLNLISGGRMQLGIGRGDSSRRVLGKKPVGAGDLERAVKTFRELTAGHEVEYEGQPTHISWAKGSPPVWIAGYGPKVLHMAGRVADGVILQFADPDLIAWCLG